MTCVKSFFSISVMLNLTFGSKHLSHRHILRILRSRLVTAGQGGSYLPLAVSWGGRHCSIFLLTAARHRIRGRNCTGCFALSIYLQNINRSKLLNNLNSVIIPCDLRILASQNRFISLYDEILKDSLVNYPLISL